MPDREVSPRVPRLTRRMGLWLLRGLALLGLVGGLLVVWGSQARRGAEQADAARTATAARAATATATAAPLAPAGTVAYMADGQVALASPGKPARQLTHLAQPDRDPTHWGPIAWAPDATHLAVAAGNPSVDANQVAGATGRLYVVSVRDGAVTLVAPAAGSSQGVAIGPQTYAWQDAAHLLVALGGRVFAYDVAAGTLAPLAGLASTTVLDLAVRRHALYYASYAAPDGPLTALPAALHRFDLLTHADSTVADLGTVLMQVTGCDVTGCIAATGAAATLPAWDVSPDESALAYERVTGLSADRTRARVAFAFSASQAPGGATSTSTSTSTSTPEVWQAFGAAVPIFAGVPGEIAAGLPNACCFLRFSPDGRALVLTSGYAMPAPFGPYIVYPRLAHSGVQTGYPWAFGPAAWRPDSRAFTLATHRGGAPTTTLLTYGDGVTSVLAENAYTCAYAPPVG